MAARTATKTGVWSDVSVWDGGATLPQPADTADSNGFTVTIDQDVTVTALVNTHAAAGLFNVASTRTITANITATTRDALQVNANSPVVVTVIGNVTGGSTTNADGIIKFGTSTLNVTGDITGGSTNTCHGLHNAATGPINITGNIVGGSNSSSFGVSSVAAATITVTGNTTGASSVGISNTSTGTVTVSGSATGGTTTNNSYGLTNTGGGTATVGLAVGNNYGPGGGSIFASGVNGGNTVGTVTRVYAIEYGPNGMAPTAGAVVLVKDPANTAEFLCSDATTRTLVVSAGGGAVSIGAGTGQIGG